MSKNKVINITRDIQAVRRRYPGAISRYDEGWYIEWNGENIFETFLHEPTHTIEEAWSLAREIAKHDQYFNRTHPLKQMGTYNEEYNKIRIAKRIHYAR